MVALAAVCVGDASKEKHCTWDRKLQALSWRVSAFFPKDSDERCVLGWLVSALSDPDSLPEAFAPEAIREVPSPFIRNEWTDEEKTSMAQRAKEYRESLHPKHRPRSFE